MAGLPPFRGPRSWIWLMATIPTVEEAHGRGPSMGAGIPPWSLDLGRKGGDQTAARFEAQGPKSGQPRPTRPPGRHTSAGPPWSPDDRPGHQIQGGGSGRAPPGARFSP